MVNAQDLAAIEDGLVDYFAEEIHSKEFTPICLLGCGAAGTELAGTFRLKPNYVPAYLPRYYPVRAIAMDTQANISDLLKRAVGWYEPQAQLHMNPPDEGQIERLLEQGASHQQSPGEYGDLPPINTFTSSRGGGAGGFTLRGRATALHHFGSDNEIRQINTEILNNANLLSRANSGYLLTFSGLGGGTGSGSVPVVVQYIQQILQPSPLATFSLCVVPERTSNILAGDDARPRDPRLLSNLVCALYYLAKCDAINGIILSDNLQIESQGHKGFRNIDQHLQDVLMPLFLSTQAHYVPRYLASAQLDPANLRMAMAPGAGGTQDFNAVCYSVCPLSQSSRNVPSDDGQIMAPDPDTGVPDLREMLEVALQNPSIQCDSTSARGVLALISGPLWALEKMVPDALTLNSYDNVLFQRCIDPELQADPRPDTISRFFAAEFSEMNEVRLMVLLRGPRMRGLENALREGLRREAPDWVPGVEGGTLADSLRRVEEPTIRQIGWAQANPLVN